MARIDSELPVNAACAKVAQGLYTERYQYLAGDCNSQARPDGVAAVKVTGTAKNAPMVLQGLFADGALVRGMLYRVSMRDIDTSIATGSRTLRRAFECRDVNVIEKTGVNLQGSDRLLITSAPGTVCAEGGSVLGSQVFGHRYTRILRPAAAQAVEVDGWPRVRIETPGTGRLLFRDRMEEIEGSFRPRNDNGEVFGRYSYSGQVRVAFVGSRIWYRIEGTALCVEGTRTCGPMYKVDGNRGNTAFGPAYTAQGAAGRMVAPRMQFNDGTVFEPQAPVQLGARPYDAFFGLSAPAGAGWQPVGDAVWVRPLEGRITYPDGRQYSGRFSDGKPLVP